MAAVGRGHRSVRSAVRGVLCAVVLAASMGGVAGDQRPLGQGGVPDSLVLPVGVVATLAPGQAPRPADGAQPALSVSTSPERQLGLVFDVAGLPNGVSALTASVHLTLSGGGGGSLGIVAVDPSSSTGFGPEPPEVHGDLLDTSGPTRGREKVILDVTRAITGEGRHVFAVITNGGGPSSVVTAGADAPVLWLAYRRAGPETSPNQASGARADALSAAVATPSFRLPSGPDATGCTVSAILVPSCGAWLGVAPGSFSDQPKAEALAGFERAIGATVDVVHTYHRAGQLFPTPDELALARERGRNRLLFMNYKPEGGHTWAEVAAGRMDPVLDRLAAHIRAVYADPFFFTVHHEPEEEVREEPGSGFTAADYAAMFRHVVERLRAQGVTNAVSVFNVMGSSKYVSREWFPRLYPGDDVVDWVAWDPYACVNPDKPCGGYADLLNQTYVPDWPGFYDYVRSAHPGKPLMLAEWGVVENGPPVRKADVVRSVVQGLADRPAIKALAYFDAGASPVGDSRVDSSAESLDAFRALAASPWFAQRPPS